VFGNAVGERLDSIKTAWKATCRRAGIEDLLFHDLRREAACRWFEAGVPLHHIRDLLGHADISTTSRYLAVTPTERMNRSVVQRCEISEVSGSRACAAGAGAPANERQMKRK
jgi:integrase